jgi:hypothetical protein
MGPGRQLHAEFGGSEPLAHHRCQFSARDRSGVSGEVALCTFALFLGAARLSPSGSRLMMRQRMLGLLILAAGIAEAALPKEICTGLTNIGLTDKATECLKIIRDGNFDPMAVDICLGFHKIGQNDQAVACLRTIKNKNYRNGVDTCSTLANIGQVAKAITCLEESGATPQHSSNLVRIPGAPGSAPIDLYDVEGRLASAIRFLEDGDRTRALSILNSLEGDVKKADTCKRLLAPDRRRSH